MLSFKIIAALYLNVSEFYGSFFFDELGFMEIPLYFYSIFPYH